MYRLLIDTAISDSTVNILGLGCIKSIIRKDEIAMSLRPILALRE